MSAALPLTAFLFWLFLCKPPDCRIWEDFAWVCAWTLSILGWLVAICPVSLSVIGMITLLYFGFARPYIKNHRCSEPDMLSLPRLQA